MCDAGVVDVGKGIGDQDLHAQNFGDVGESTADMAIADDAETAAGELPPHDHLRLPSGVVVRGRARNSPRQIDHEAERKFGHGLNKARSGAGDQHASGGCRLDVDVADIDRAADEGDQLRKLREDLAPAFGQAVGDDDVDVARGGDQVRRIQRIIGLVQLHLRDGAQAVEAALAVILAAKLRRMGQKNFHEAPSPISERYPASA